MNKLFYTYTLAKTLYERSGDYVDTFWPFVIKVLPEDKSLIGLVSIQEKLKESFGLDVPEHTLRIIINRAKDKKYIETLRGKHRITEKGNNYINSFEPESVVDRRINALLENIRKHLNKKLSVTLDIDSVRDILLSFVKDHLYPVIEFFKPDTEIGGLEISASEMREYEEELVDYFKITQERKPNFYNTLKDIVYGSIISTVASSSDIEKINRGFQDTSAFLDSNFLFSVFGIDPPEFSKPARELFDLLKKYKIELRVFDFTIEQMIKVLKNYPGEQHSYITGVRVNSIYSSLKNQGWTIEDVKLFIRKIEEKIQNLDIGIERTNININTYKPEKNEYISALLSYKFYLDLSPQSINHDLVAIEEIKKMRKSPKRDIETSGAFFLTSDLKLSRFNLEIMGHKDRATICEVIPDRVLTNILWLKNPTVIKDIPLKSIIAVHSRKIFIDRKIWKQFYKNMKKLREKEMITDRDISMLFYDHQIENVLSKIDEKEVDKITPEFILEHFSHITDKIKGRIKEVSEKRAKRWVNIISWTFILGVISVVIISALKLGPKIVYEIIGKWDIIEPIFWVIGVILSILIILISIVGVKITRETIIKKIKKWLETKISTKIYKAKLTEVRELFSESVNKKRIL